VSPGLRVAFGHCTWAAPLVMAIPRLRNYEFASFEAGNAPYWISGGADLGALKYPDPRPGGGAFTPMAADRVLELLDSPHDVDVCAVPGRVVTAMPAAHGNKRLVATIVDSGPGCSLSMPERAYKILRELTFTKNSHRLAYTTAEVACAFRLLQENTGDNATPVIVAQDGTIAKFYAEEVRQNLQNFQDIRVELSIPAADLQDATFGQIEERCNEVAQGDRKRKLMGIISWEPHASWLKKRDRTVHNVLLQLAPPYDQRLAPASFTFDLVVSTAKLPSARAIMQFLDVLKGAADKVIFGTDVAILKKYFSLEDIASAVNKVRYNVYPHGEFWLDQLRRQ